MTSSITLQRCANGVICIPADAGNPPDLARAYIFGDITSVASPGTAALLAFINQSLGQPLPTVAEIKADLQETAETLANPEQLP